MNIALLVVLIVVGALVLVGGIVFVAITSVRRVVAREAAELAGEGIVLDSGSVTLKARFTSFRGPSVYLTGATRTGPSRVVLTKQRLVFVPSGANRYGFARMDREQLARFKVGVSEGKLHLHSDQPPNASGTVDLLLSVSDAESWVRALTEAGAQAG